jgi:hypothetical protein
MAHTKQLVLTFYPASKQPENDGYFYVCFQVLGLKLQYSFGYARWDHENKEWECPSDDCMVYMWTIEPSASLLF